jgi:hypothetical protein
MNVGPLCRGFLGHKSQTGIRIVLFFVPQCTSRATRCWRGSESSANIPAAPGSCLVATHPTSEDVSSNDADENGLAPPGSTELITNDNVVDGGHSASRLAQRADQIATGSVPQRSRRLLVVRNRRRTCSRCRPRPKPLRRCRRSLGWITRHRLMRLVVR